MNNLINAVQRKEKNLFRGKYLSILTLIIIIIIIIIILLFYY